MKVVTHYKRIKTLSMLVKRQTKLFLTIPRIDGAYASDPGFVDNPSQPETRTASVRGYPQGSFANGLYGYCVAGQEPASNGAG